MVTDANLTFSVSDNYVKMEDKTNGTASQAKEFVFVAGRIANQHPGIVGRSNNGVFYTPVLIRQNGELLGHTNGTFIKQDGKTTIELGTYESVGSRKEICLPTLISNPVEHGAPQFHNLIAYGENALQIANTPVGSSIQVVGEIKDCWVGNYSIPVLWINKIVSLKKKGVSL